jgi:hypothetical protein
MAVAMMGPDSLREPRAGVHEDGTEEMKSWETLYEQCVWAADRIEALTRLLAERTTEGAIEGCDCGNCEWERRVDAAIAAGEKEEK